MMRVVDDGFLRQLMVRGREARVVMVGAAWCPDTVRMWEKVIPPLAERYGPAVDFVRIDVEDSLRQPINPESKDFFRPERFPTLVVFQEEGMIKKTSEGGKEEQRKDAVEFVHWAADVA